jgi:hypothetical protein
MKNGKRPTLKQKIILKQARLNPDNWLVIKILPGRLELVNRDTGRKKILLHA